MHELILYVACPNDTTANVQGYAHKSNKIVTDQCPQSSRHCCKTLLQLSLVWLEFLIITIFFLLVYHIVTRPCIYFSLSVSGLRCESSNLSRDTQTSLSGHILQRLPWFLLCLIPQQWLTCWFHCLLMQNTHSCLLIGWNIPLWFLEFFHHPLMSRMANSFWGKIYFCTESH